MPIALVEDPEAFDAALALVEEFGGAADLSEAAIALAGDADAHEIAMATALSPNDDDELLTASLVAVELPDLGADAASPFLYGQQDLSDYFLSTDGSFSSSVDGNDSSHSAQSSLQPVAQPAKRSKMKAAPKPRTYNPNRARDEEKKELTYLRTKVVEMEQKLRAMQDAQRAKRAAASSPIHRFPQSITQSGDNQEQSLSTSSDCARNVWKEMASHQLEQRLQSERENRHLKTTLEAQIKVAKSLEKLLQNRATASAMESFGNSTRSRRIYASGSDRSAASRFQELLDGVDESYNEVDALFRANGLAAMETSYRDAQMREDTDGGLYMEIFANKVLPFGVRETGHAAWQYFAHSMEHLPFRLMYQKDPQNLECTDDTVVQGFGMELHANGTKADFRVKQILRRFVEDEREVIVWRSFIDPVEFSGEPLSGAEFLEKGYIVIKRAASSSTGDFSLLQSCFIVTPELPIRSLHEGAITGALTDFVLSGTAATIAASHQMIENILFDQVMKARSRV